MSNKLKKGKKVAEEKNEIKEIKSLYLVRISLYIFICAWMITLAMIGAEFGGATTISVNRIIMIGTVILVAVYVHLKKKYHITFKK